MSFWDNVKKFAQPYSEEDYDDYEEEMDAYEEQAQEALAIFTEHCADAEINLLDGGQPVYYYLISAE